MSFQSPENQLKEAIAALGELKSLAETMKVSAEAKTQNDDRLAKVEASIASVSEQIDTLAKKMPQFIKDKIKEKEDGEEEANEIGGVNPTVISKKKKQPIAAEVTEDEELMDEPVKKKSKKLAAETTEDEDVTNEGEGEVEEGEDEAELEADAKKKKAGIPPQFLKNIKKMKDKAKNKMAAEEDGEDEAEAGAEADAEEQDMEEEEMKAKKSSKKTKAAEPMNKKEEDEENTEEEARDCGPKGKPQKGKFATEQTEAPVADEPSKEINAQETTIEAKAEEAPVAPAVEATSAPAEVLTPVAQEVADVAPVAEEVKIETKAEAPVINAELEALKAELSAQAKAREEALASVSKVKAEFESLMERISKSEKAEKTAEEKVAKTIASLGVRPVASDAIASDDKPKTSEELAKEYQALEQTDPKEARKFWLKNAEAIRSAAFGKSVRHFS